jgi:hypothetical protein
MFKLLRRLIVLAFVLATLWLISLAVLGELGSRWVAVRMQEKLSKSLGAQVQIGGVDLGLVRGQFELAQLDLRRREVGAMHIVIQEAVLDTAPLGLAVLHRDRADKLTIRGLTIELSSWAVLAPPPGNPLAFHVGSFDFSSVKLLLAPTLLLPGAGSITLDIDRAKGGATTLRSAVSWLFSVDELDARLGLPGGATATIRYRASRTGAAGAREGKLVIGSSLLARELTIPLTMPTIVNGDELTALRQLGTRITREVTKNKALQLLQKIWH